MQYRVSSSAPRACTDLEPPPPPRRFSCRVSGLVVGGGIVHRGKGAEDGRTMWGGGGMGGEGSEAKRRGADHGGCVVVGLSADVVVARKETPRWTVWRLFRSREDQSR